MKSSNPYNGIKACETARTIDTNGGNPACNQGGTVLVKCIGNGQVDQLNLSDKVGALNCMHDQQGIIQGIATQSYSELRLSDKAATLMAKGGVCGETTKTMPCKEYNNRLIGPLCARDYKGIGNQYVSEGKLVIEGK